MAARFLDSGAWLQAWRRLPDDRREAYLHPGWAAASGEWERARPACLYAESTGGWMICPTLLHPVGEACDAQTPYGYGGPIFIGEWSEEARVRALADCGDLLRGEKAVAEFVRCHPHWCDSESLQHAGYSTFPVRTNVECTLEAEDFTGAWAGSARRNLRKAMSAGLGFRVGESAEDWAIFQSIYAATARRLEMTPFYRFDARYFSGIALVPGVVLVIVEDGGGGARCSQCAGDASLGDPSSPRAVAAAVILVGGRLAHYHLGGSDFAFQHLRPNELLYFAMASVARRAGCEAIVWGGGMSNDPADSLLRFKSHFGAIHRPVHCGGRVIDPAKFGALCEAWAARNAGRQTAMFLKYRA